MVREPSSESPARRPGNRRDCTRCGPPRTVDKLSNMQNTPNSGNLEIEIRLRSTVNSKSNSELQQEILAAAPDLQKELRADAEAAHAPTVEKTQITPEAAFPGAVEAFLITVAISFGMGVAKGFAEGVGE